MIVIGLGTVWILDGLEVTIVGSIGDRLTEAGSGITLDASQIGTAAAFYVGAAAGAFASVALLDTALFAADVGWRLAFGLGALLGVGILIVRRHVPESPRWLFIHGREEEADRIVGQIEREVQEETGEKLPEPDRSLVVHQRERIPFREIARTAFQKYPRRTILGLSLFVDRRHRRAPLRRQGRAETARGGGRTAGRYWGPGRFHEALREAVAKGRAKRLPRGEYAPVEEQRPTAESASEG